MWPLHTSEALAPLLVALAYIQVALAPISVYWNCGPCTCPLHFFSWPLHWPLHLENAPFWPSKRYSSSCDSLIRPGVYLIQKLPNKKMDKPPDKIFNKMHLFQLEEVSLLTMNLRRSKNNKSKSTKTMAKNAQI